MEQRPRIAVEGQAPMNSYLEPFQLKAETVAGS